MYCVFFVPTGTVVIMMQPANTPAGQTYHYLGMGKIEDPVHHTNIPPNAVLLHVLAIENVASSLVKVGQVVIWPKTNLAIPQGQPENTCGTTQPSDPNPPAHPDEDGVRNYALQCIQLGVMLMQLNDTEREGDGDRCIRNWKLLLLYFRARKHGMKYAFEAMRLLTCVKGILTEKIAHRIIHGQFVNPNGGAGNNYANDLKMENLVKNHKVILKGLCGNKTLKAVSRTTSATHGLTDIIHKVDKETNVPPNSTCHSHASTTQMIKEMITTLHQVNPLACQRGTCRSLRSFPNITKSPLDKLDVTALHQWLTSSKKTT